MKQQLITALQNAVDELLSQSSSEVSAEAAPAVSLEVPRNPEHGDFSSNAAMLLAKPLKRAPRDIAADLVAKLDNQSFIERIDIAGPGFINFSLTGQAVTQVLESVRQAGKEYGKSKVFAGRKILVEFVSANPTGPLHVGHGRGAAYGDAIAGLLEAVGAEATREYYVNDAGRQMDILTLSVWIRYLQQHDLKIELPSNAYQGVYIVDIAKQLAQAYDKALVPAETPIIQASSADEAEAALDKAIALCRENLHDSYPAVAKFVCDQVLAGIKQDLASFNIEFDNWFSENSLVASGALGDAVSRLEKEQRIYLKDGAKWFRSTDYGDEKDRVVVRENGLSTYFASDIAYHAEKISREFDQLINIWGADHHGYIARVRAAMTAMGIDEKQLEIILVQFAALFRDGEKVAMSTRSGEFVTLKELIDEVGSDAARYFYLSRRADQHLDFDLDLAKSKSNENPVYYVQYAHARICSVFEQLSEKGLDAPEIPSDEAAAFLTDEKEKALLTSLAQFPEQVLSAAQNREPHTITNYLRELAGEFHAYYNSTKILIEDAEIRASRLSLISATRQVLYNGLSLLSISAPTKM